GMPLLDRLREHNAVFLLQTRKTRGVRASARIGTISRDARTSSVALTMRARVARPAGRRQWKAAREYGLPFFFRRSTQLSGDEVRPYAAVRRAVRVAKAMIDTF